MKSVDGQWQKIETDFESEYHNMTLPDPKDFNVSLHGGGITQ